MEPDLKLLAPASRMLQAVAVGCDQACTAITAASLPQLLDQFHSRSMVRGMERGERVSSMCVHH